MLLRKKRSFKRRAARMRPPRWLLFRHSDHVLEFWHKAKKAHLSRRRPFCRISLDVGRKKRDEAQKGTENFQETGQKPHQVDRQTASGDSRKGSSEGGLGHAHSLDLYCAKPSRKFGLGRCTQGIPMRSNSTNSTADFC